MTGLRATPERCPERGLLRFADLGACPTARPFALVARDLADHGELLGTCSCRHHWRRDAAIWRFADLIGVAWGHRGFLLCDRAIRVVRETASAHRAVPHLRL